MIHMFPFVAAMLWKKVEPNRFKDIRIGDLYEQFGKSTLLYRADVNGNPVEQLAPQDSKISSVWVHYYDAAMPSPSDPNLYLIATASVAVPEVLGKYIKLYIPGLFFPDPHQEKGDCAETINTK
jgi:hypothetical protein